MITLYAVTRALPADAEVSGLSIHTVGALSVLHEHVPAGVAATREALLAHGQRISELADRFALLPMRYGTQVASTDDLERLVGEHGTTWSRRLAAVEGHCELLVHARLPEIASSTQGPPSGREYLLRRAEVWHRAEHVWEELAEVVGDDARERHVLPDHRRMAVLVPRDRVSEVRQRVAGWAAEHPGARVAVTGPWPPFSFCEEPAAS